jgi:hypothetical protein
VRQVDGRSVKELTTAEVHDLIEGPADSTVTILVEREHSLAVFSDPDRMHVPLVRRGPGGPEPAMALTRAAPAARLRELAAVGPVGTRRLLVLGDSLVSGVGCHEAPVRPARSRQPRRRTVPV